MTLVFCFAGYILLQIPSEEEIRGCIVTKMYEVHLCPGSKTYVPLQKISAVLPKTIVLTEDSNFWNHQGFDWESIEKDAKEDWEKGVFKRGGSTITQQLAKNMFLTKDKSLLRKGIEALITQKLEKTLKKKEILERYLNVIEFGKNIYGIKAAAQYYFKKSPADLNVVESAFLAMLLPNPVKYSQSFYKKELSSFARKRITQIVENMYRYNRISQTEYDIATTELEGFLHAGQQQSVEKGQGKDTVELDPMTLDELEKTDTNKPDEEEEDAPLFYKRFFGVLLCPNHKSTEDSSTVLQRYLKLPQDLEPFPP